MFFLGKNIDTENSSRGLNNVISCNFTDHRVFIVIIIIIDINYREMIGQPECGEEIQRDYYKV